MAKKKTRQKTPNRQSSKRSTRRSQAHLLRHENLGVPKQDVDHFLGLYDAKRLEDAEQAAWSMVRRYPDSAFSWKALGTTLLERGRAEEAQQNLERSVALDAADPLALTSLAAAHFQRGNHSEAVRHQVRAVELRPDYAPAHFLLAEMLQSAGRQLEGLKHAREAQRLGYDDFRSRVLVGALMYQSKYFSEALEVYKALENDYPGHAAVYNNLGNLYKDVSQYELAEKYYKKALDADPDHATAYSNIFYAKHYNPDVNQAEIIDFAREWESRFGLQRFPETSGRRDPEKPLRVGMISSGFRGHPVGQMIATALEHSRRDIHFYAYTTNDQVDDVTKKIRESTRVWRSVRHLSQKALAQQVRDDAIDILIDLSGHGDGNSLQAISRRPAPLCIKWVGGLVNTMGLSSIDYLLSDSIETPEGVDDQYVEKLIRLPDDYICYMPCLYAPATTSLPAVKNGYVTLGCLNNPAKIGEVLLGEWAKLMHQLPESRLLLRGLQYESEDFCQWVRDTLAEHGIDEYRVILEGPAKHKEFLETYQRIDIALDTWPYSGGLTTCEAMLMGVPVVTLPGPTFAGRHSATHLTNAGLPELVTSSWEEYRQRVMELAGDLPNLAVIRAGLRTILHYSPVCDAPRFANHFNNALRAIWQRHCDGKPTEALTFNKEGEAWFAGETGPVELVEAREEDEPENTGFEWQLDEPITVVDNAAVLPRHPDYPKWMESGNLAVVSFDPASLLNDRVEALKEHGELHHYPHALLGDGQPATFYATLDAEKGSTLKPLPLEKQPGYQRDKLQVLAELPINTVALDQIEGLPSVDMLVLDDLHDAKKILENGEQTLKDTLLIQVRVAFQPTHEGQTNLAELNCWASRNGFRFYRLHDLKYLSHFPEDLPEAQLKATELISGDALLLPNNSRIEVFSDRQRDRLAFMLDDFFGLEDIVYTLLSGSGFARRYLFEKTMSHLSVRRQDGLIKNVETRSDALLVHELVSSIRPWRMEAIDALVQDCEKAMSIDPTNNAAHFVLTHALLAHRKCDNAIVSKELGDCLEAVGWQHKKALYGYWVTDCERIREIKSGYKISVILISNKFKEDIVSNAVELRSQCPDIEIVFVNNGEPKSDFLSLLPLVDFYVELRRNSGPCTARNVGAIFARSEIIIFVDDDGFPGKNFLDAHVEMHEKESLACLRGAYQPRSERSGFPAHYNLGRMVVPSPPTLEGNCSFRKKNFLKVDGWGDYILFGHAGLDISARFFEMGFYAEQQLYTPRSTLFHDYFRGVDHAQEKKRKMQASWELIKTLRGDFEKSLSVAFNQSAASH